MALDDDALTRALIMGGLAMMQGRGNPMNVIGQGGMFAMQDMSQQKLLRAKLMEEEQQAQARAIAIQKAQALQAIMTGAAGAAPQPAGSQRSVVDAPDWKPQVAAVPQKSLPQKLFDAGFIKEAEEAAKAQGAIHGEAYGDIKVSASGKPYYMTKQGPRYTEDGSFVPREELHFGDTGDRTNVGFDKYTGQQKSQGVVKGMSLAEKDASSRGWADVNLARARFDRGEYSGSVPLPDGGTGAGFITPQGFTQAPGTGVKQPEVPATIKQALAQNDVTLNKIGRALEAVDAYPQAFGAKNVFGDTIRQRTDPEGVDARALVADIGSQKLHDRSGAAVTVSEAPRLVPFVPNVNDKPETIKKKLQLFQQEYAAMHAELSKGYSINQVAAPANKNVGTVGKQPSGAEVEAEMRRRGLKP